LQAAEDLGDEVGIADGQGTGEVYGIGAAHGVRASQFAGAAFDRRGQLDGRTGVH
jgi:hypothetical protein